MKFAVFCIGGLNKAILSRVRLEVLDSLPTREMASTIPTEPITAWTSAWTGYDPAVHGKVTGVKGRKPKLATIWDEAKRNGEKIVIYNEGEWEIATECDIGIYKLDSVATSIVAGDLAKAQESLNLAMETIDACKDIPYLIVSAFGTAKYFTSLNVDKLLIARGLIKLSSRGGIEYQQTHAYPANYEGRKPRSTHGIYLNSVNRASGFMAERHVMNVQGQLMIQLNQTHGIEARPAHTYYDIGGEYFPDMPDIILSSPSNQTYFRSVGAAEFGIISPYYDYGVSTVGLIASNDESLIDGVQTVMDVKNIVGKGIKKA